MASQDAKQFNAGVSRPAENPGLQLPHVNVEHEIVTIASKCNPAGILQKPSLLADLVDIRHQIRSDVECDRETVRQRDRDIGLRIRPRKNDVATLRAWMADIRQGRGGQGRQTQRSIFTLVATLWLAGLACGWLLGETALRYDGSGPVNILHALMILVGSQLLLLAALVVLLALGLEKTREALAFINPAVWMSRLIARLQPAWRPAIRELLDGQGVMKGRGVRRWLLIYLAQHFTVALNLGIVAVLFYLVTVSDLAFGWSTTLSVDHQAVTGLFDKLSSPWQWILPAAAPDADLVGASRYYRLQSPLHRSAESVAELGTWWLFMLLCVLVYGLLPRTLALLYAGIRYDRAVISAIRNTTGAAQVLSRMRSPLVFSGAVDAETGGVDAEDTPPLRRRQAGRALSAVVIEWSGAKADHASLSRAGISAERFFTAGGNHSPDADRALVDRIGVQETDAVVMVTGSWEPPMMEFIDFLEELHKRMDPSGIRIVVLMPLDKRGKVAPEDLAAWESTLYAMEDPSLYVEVL